MKVSTVLKLDVQLQKSFEGEFRVVVRKPDEDTNIITMPWIVGRGQAIRQFGKLLQSQSEAVNRAVESGTPLSKVTP